MKKEIGKKVICINADFGESPSVYPYYGFPILNQEYTIRGFCSTGESILLEELRNPYLSNRIIDTEVSFYNKRFKLSEQ